MIPPRASTPCATLVLTTLVAPFLLAGGASALPHGGFVPSGPPPPIYLGPGDSHGGFDPPGKTEPKTPGYTGPGDTGGGPKGPRSPGGSAPSSPPAVGPNAPGPMGPTTPSGLGDSPPDDLGDWWWWWEFNRHGYLDLKARVRSRGALTGGDDFYLGEGRPEDRGDLGPAEDVLAQRVLPALLAALEDERQNDVLTGCLVALAKIGERDGGPERQPLRQAIERFLADDSQEVAETATLALGILGDEGAAPSLVSILEDTESGRGLAGRGSVPARTRAFAAYALGLIGARTEREDVRRFVVHHLERELERRDTGGLDLPVACVLAIGLVPLETVQDPVPLDDGLAEQPAGTSRRAQVARLLALVRDRKESPFVRAHAATSAGRLVAALADGDAGGLRAEVTTQLAERLKKRSKDPRELLQSCAQALGFLGDCDEDEVDELARKRLFDVGSNHADNQVRAFALIALGRIASRPGSGERADRAAPDIHKHLLRQLARGKSRQKPWAGLSLGLMTRELAQSGRAAGAKVTDALRNVVSDERSPQDLAAYCVSAGLARDVGSGDLMLEHLVERKDPWLRGYAAVGLGLVPHGPAIEPIREIAADSRYRPVLQSRLAIALGLAGDKSAVPMLVEMLEASDGLAARATISSALGWIGDARAVDPLLEMLASEEATASARGFAAVALGIAGDKDALPWSALVSTGLNYTATPGSLFDTSQGRGVLNIL